MHHALAQHFEFKVKRIWVGYPEKVLNRGLRVKETPRCILTDILLANAAINFFSDLILDHEGQHYLFSPDGRCVSLLVACVFNVFMP